MGGRRAGLASRCAVADHRLAGDQRRGLSVTLLADRPRDGLGVIGRRPSTYQPAAAKRSCGLPRSSDVRAIDQMPLSSE